jgi:glycosyltransferase involved in cell wall biosynthesis
LHEGEPGARELAERLRGEDVPVDEIRVRVAADPVALARLVRMVRAVRPTIVHTHLVHADFLGLTAAAAARVPFRVSTKHGFNTFRAGRAFAVADRSVARFAHAHVAISLGLARYLAETEGFAESAFTVVHYGIEPGPEPQPYVGEAGRLVCVGRLIPIKGHEVLFRAFAEARAELPSLQLDLAGAGPLEPELRAQAVALGVGEAVRFLGAVTPIGPVYESAAVTIVPSLGEGFGMVALEAMERGRPVIASAVGGLPEILTDGETGLVVPPGDASALSDAIVALVADPGRAVALGVAGRRRALEEFSQRRCTAGIEAVYSAAAE